MLVDKMVRYPARIEEVLQQVINHLQMKKSLVTNLIYRTIQSNDPIVMRLNIGRNIMIDG